MKPLFLFSVLVLMSNFMFAQVSDVDSCAKKTDEILSFSVKGVTFEMVKVKGGTFSMGAQSETPDGTNYDSDADNDEMPIHSVTLSDYYIGKFEVTQELWKTVMGKNPSGHIGDKYPIEKVSWNDCQEFINKLNQLLANQLEGKHFALPTEAQWEYAARGGNKSQHYKYSGSNTVEDVAWYNGNAKYQTHQVGTKAPNELGLYDMSGNVWEWCADWYGGYSGESCTNPQGSGSGSWLVVRGGCWLDFAESCRVAIRYTSYPRYTYDSLGFRLVCM